MEEGKIDASWAREIYLEFLIQGNLAGIPRLKHQNQAKLRLSLNSVSLLFTIDSPPACMVANPEKCPAFTP